jgi:uncharacterized SAM-binding protein YcdF (DUF218 family)
MAYGVLIAGTHSGSVFFIFWIALTVVFIGMSVCAHFHVWKMIDPVLRKICIVVLVLGLATFLGIEGCVVSGFDAEGELDLDYIIVLGAQVKDSGPSRVLKYRLDKAYDYLQENENTICIVSGGQGKNEPVSEAEGMYEYLTGRGIDPERIYIEDASKTTAENLRLSQKYFDAETDRVGIVTNNFHMFRSLCIARRAGVKNVCGITAESTPVFLPNNMVRECLAIIKMYLLLA